MPLEVPCVCGKRFNIRVPDDMRVIPKKFNCPACGAELNDTANRLLAQRHEAQSAEEPVFVPIAQEPMNPRGDVAPPNPFAVDVGAPKVGGVSKANVASDQTDDEAAKNKLNTFEMVWCGIPLVLIAIGGAIGGACGGTAFAINQSIFKQTKNPIRYLLTILVSIAAGAVWFMAAMSIRRGMR